MDNITHSLIGVAIGEGTCAWAGKDRQPALAASLIAAVFASNAPDLDVLGRLLMSRTKSDGGLGFLLQHRGFTHGFLLAPVEAMMAAALAWFVIRKPERRTLRLPGLFAIALLGVLLHIGADYWNDYGIHPFSPFLNRWFYGDFIFIVEPMIWFSLLPLLVFQRELRWLCVLGGLLWVGMLGAAWFGPVSGVGTSLWLSLWALANLGLGFCTRDLSRHRAWAVSVLSTAVVLSLFWMGSGLARNRIRQALALGPTVRSEIASSPFPGNPLLWRAIVAWVSSDGIYQVQPFTLSLMPSLFSPPAEFFRSGPQPPPTPDPTVAGVLRLERFQGRAADLQELAKRYCRIRGILSFARFPYWRELDGRIEVGDLRYGRRGRNFAQIDIAADSRENCAENAAPWIPPISSIIPID